MAPKRRITQPRKASSKTAVRRFDAAQSSRLTADWVTGEGTGDKHIRQDAAALRERARDLERNDGYAESFFMELESNVVGEMGIMLKSLAMKADGRAAGGILGKADENARQKVEAAWADHSKKGNFEVTRSFSRAQFERLIMRSLARDGGFLVRLVDGFPNNAAKFAAQGLEIDVLDPRYSDPEKRIHMSVEHDEWDAPVKYHLLKPDAKSIGLGYQSRERTEVDAANMLHLFMSKRITQSQGFSWLAPVMTRLRHLSKYEEAEVIAARISANKVGFFESTEQGGYTGEDDGQGNIKAPSGPGEWEQLPFGVKPHLIDPTHPNANYPDFRKAILRGVCAGIYINYNTLAKDLEGVSYSSIRQGVLSERDIWRLIQSFLIQEFEQPVFERWLRMALMTGQIEGLGLADYDRLKHSEFSGRTWPWVDPLKDINALKEEIALGLNSRQAAARDKGRDFAKILKENESDVEQLEAAGLMENESVPTDADDEGRGEAVRFETLKAKFDAYGVGVRAGSITPQTADEESFRKEGGLPKMSADVKGAWKSDKGVRRPITLVSQPAYEETQDAVADNTDSPPADDAGDSTE